MATAQETRQKRLAAADGAARHETFAVGVVGDQALIPLELGPREIAFVVVQEQDVPIRPLAPEPTHDPLAAGLDRHPAACPTEGIGAGIDRIMQNMVDRVVDRQTPGDAAAVLRRIANHRQGDMFLSEPKVDLAHALELREFGKNQRQSFTNPLIRILLDAVMTNLHVPYRDRHEEFAAPRFLLQGFD